MTLYRERAIDRILIVLKHRLLVMTGQSQDSKRVMPHSLGGEALLHTFLRSNVLNLLD